MPATAPRSLHRVPLDREAHTLTWRLTVGDLTGAETEAHPHGPAAAGQSAPVLVHLGLGVTKGGVWSFPAGLEQALVSGDAYVDVHTDGRRAARPARAPRGGSGLHPALGNEGAQGSNSPATGSGSLHADTLINRLRFEIAEAGLLGKEHIHAGARS